MSDATKKSAAKKAEPEAPAKAAPKAAAKTSEKGSSEKSSSEKSESSEKTASPAKKAAPKKAAEDSKESEGKGAEGKAAEGKAAEGKGVKGKGTSTKGPTKSAPGSTEKPKAKPDAQPPSAFSKPLTPSKELSAVLGSSEPLPRTAVVSKVWEYIKEHKLQNEANKREILADAKLKPIFGKDKVTMFEMNKYLNAHLKS